MFKVEPWSWRINLTSRPTLLVVWDNWVPSTKIGTSSMLEPNAETSTINVFGWKIVGKTPSSFRSVSRCCYCCTATRLVIVFWLETCIAIMEQRRAHGKWPLFGLVNIRHWSRSRLGEVRGARNLAKSTQNYTSDCLRLWSMGRVWMKVSLWQFTPKCFLLDLLPSFESNRQESRQKFETFRLIWSF